MMELSGWAAWLALAAMMVWVAYHLAFDDDAKEG